MSFDYLLVFKTAKEDISELETQIELILKKHNNKL